jgi:hypothetical protein
VEFDHAVVLAVGDKDSVLSDPLGVVLMIENCGITAAYFSVSVVIR